MTATRKAEEMTPNEFKAAIDRFPVVILATGILEWHADHLPLGLDALKMRGIAERLAERTGAILLPQQWFGVVGFEEMRGTITFSKDLVKRIAHEFFRNLEKMGAKVIVFVTGHYGPYQVGTVKEAAAEYMADHDVRIIAQPEYEGPRGWPVEPMGNAEIYLVRLFGTFAQKRLDSDFEAVDARRRLGRQPRRLANSQTRALVKKNLESQFHATHIGPSGDRPATAKDD